MEKLFDGIRGTDTRKIPVFPFIVYFTRVMDGVETLQDMAADEKFNFSAEEVAELQVYLVKVGEKITASVAERLAALGKNDANAIKVATEDARAFWFTRVWHTLCGIEYKFVSLDEVKTIFGIA